MIISGGCLCGRVRYRIDGSLGPLVYCHCVQCRKAQGVGFAANVPVPMHNFEIVTGTGFVKGYCASPDKTRYFCANCGAPLYSHVTGAANIRLRVGSVDGAPTLTPSAHIFMSSKAPWIMIADDLPQYPEREPGRN